MSSQKDLQAKWPNYGEQNSQEKLLVPGGETGAYNKTVHHILISLKVAVKCGL